MATKDHSVTTPVCMACHFPSTLEVTEDEYRAIMLWKNGALIQDALPHWSADQRELLKTGTHPACWDEMFSEPDDDDANYTDDDYLDWEDVDAQ